MDSASGIVDAKVYTGTWTNWSRGPILGSTLTLTRENANLVIAFTAFFIGLIASRAWRIVAFVLHRAHSVPHVPKDALHHQRQAVLRNWETPGSTLWSLGQIVWAWRRSGHRPFAATLPTLLSATFCIAGFALLSGFSSQITTGIGDEVLLDGSNCGIPLQLLTPGSPLPATSEGDLLIERSETRRVSDAVNYAEQCYRSLSSLAPDSQAKAAGVFDCNSFVIPSLPATVDLTAPCPFGGGICQNNTESANLLLDTGYIDSHAHLGLNGPKKGRILMRHKYQCAPLRTEGYTSQGQTNGVHHTRYHYGNTKQGRGKGAALTFTTLNYTLMVPSVDSQYSLEGIESTRIFTASNLKTILLHSMTQDQSPYQNTSTFSPIPELQRPDGDVSIFFLIGNGVFFLHNTSDAWYRATVPVAAGYEVTPYRNDTKQVFRPEEAASPLGCVAQYQFCRASDHSCGPLASWMDSVSGAVHLFETSLHELGVTHTSNTTLESRFNWFMVIMGWVVSQPSLIATYPGSKKLLSEQTMKNGVQIGKLEDQWKRDITHWWFTWLSLLQISFAETASGSPLFALLSDAGAYLRPPNKTEQDMCSNQKIKSRKHASFSMFGLCFIYAAGLLIFIISHTLEWLFDRIRKGSNKNVDWITSDTLHLQALGFQGQGRGTWSRFHTAVPITRPGELLEPLLFDDSNSKASVNIGASAATLIAGTPATTWPSSISTATTQHASSTAATGQQSNNNAEQTSVNGSASSSISTASPSASQVGIRPNVMSTLESSIITPSVTATSSPLATGTDGERRQSIELITLSQTNQHGASTTTSYSSSPRSPEADAAVLTQNNLPDGNLTTEPENNTAQLPSGTAPGV